MKLPLSWLKDFVDFSVSSKKLAELLTLSGSEVEKIHAPQRLGNVVVGEILSIRKHPNADKLQLVMAQTSQDPKAPHREIVCGASNIKVGDRVPVALPGAILAGGFTLARKEVRGVVSDGMLCAADELGIGGDHSGIVLLQKDALLGAPVSEILGLDDTVFELDITPNRGDCLSVRGLAREIVALTQRKLKSRKLEIRNWKFGGPGRLHVRVEDRRACPLYYARLIEGVKIGSSPLVIQQRLAAAGLRPINVAVDIANYVMIELGQPLHVFDAAKIATGEEVLGGKYKVSGESSARTIELMVRRAHKGEALKLLDGKTYDLAPNDLVIAAGKRADDLAGVMGGEESATTQETKAIVLEAAIFDPVTIRRTWKRHGLRTEAAIRFEKRVDPAAVEEALDRATALLLEHCGGGVQQTVKVGALPRPARAITVFPERIAATIGTEVSAVKQKRILASLGFTVKLKAKSYKLAAFTVTSPSWRHDIEGPHDLVEEVGRMLPYNTLPTTALVGSIVPPRSSSGFVAERRVRRAFLDCGFDELLLYSFYGVRDIERMGLKVSGHARVENPFSSTQEYLRSSLLPQLLEAAGKNASLGLEPNVFEIGRVFQKSAPTPRGRSSDLPRGSVGEVGGMRETLHVAAVARAGAENLRALKAALVAARIPDAQAHVLSRQNVEPWKLRMSVIVVEAAIEGDGLHGNRAQFVPLPAFPPVRRDLSIVVAQGVSYAAVLPHLRGSDGIDLSVELFEVFEGKPLSLGTKSFGFHLTYSALSRTLTSEEVDRIQDKVRAQLERALGATVRS